MDYRLRINAQRPRAEREMALSALLERQRLSIVHSAPIRRLQQKTQVFPLEVRSSVRTRLTHSLEVQQCGRRIATLICGELAKELPDFSPLSEPFCSLVEMGCLMHDLGNPPFGHFGEQVLQEWLTRSLEPLALAASLEEKSEQWALLVRDLCQFDGNAQALRIVHTLHDFNLCFSQLATLVKYTRGAYELEQSDHSLSYLRHKAGFFLSEASVVSSMWQHLGITPGHRHPLNYIVETADDIAYCIADLEDGVDKGILHLSELITHLRTQWQLNGGGEYLDRLLNQCEKPEPAPHSFFVVLRDLLLNDLCEQAANCYLMNHTAIFVGDFNQPLLKYDKGPAQLLRVCKLVAQQQLFCHREIETLELRGYSALRGLLDIYSPLLAMPMEAFQSLSRDSFPSFVEGRLFHRLPPRHLMSYQIAVNCHSPDFKSFKEQEWYYRVRLVIDFISGMTDPFVLDEYQQLSAI